MLDGIFFINHAINGASHVTIYNQKERYEQTLETINSINKYCPSNKIFIFDSSAIFPKTEYIIDLTNRGVKFLHYGNDDRLYDFSSSGYRSIAESISFRNFIKWFKTQNYVAKRIYKISGRYRLNENFILNEDRYENAFVFAKSVESPFLKDADNERIKIMVSGLLGRNNRKKEKDEVEIFRRNFSRYYKVRLWHMDYNLLDTFEIELKNILNDCFKYNNIKYELDVEHSYYKNLHKYNVIELDKIGVCGNIALNGKYIDE